MLTHIPGSELRVKVMAEKDRNLVGRQWTICQKRVFRVANLKRDLQVSSDSNIQLQSSIASTVRLAE